MEAAGIEHAVDFNHSTPVSEAGATRGGDGQAWQVEEVVVGPHSTRAISKGEPSATVPSFT